MIPLWSRWPCEEDRFKDWHTATPGGAALWAISLGGDDASPASMLADSWGLSSCAPPVIWLVHCLVGTGHFRVTKTLHWLRLRFYWPGCRQDVELHVHWCNSCTAQEGPTQRSHASHKQAYETPCQGEDFGLGAQGWVFSSKRKKGCFSCWRPSGWVHALLLRDFQTLCIGCSLSDGTGRYYSTGNGLHPLGPWLETVIQRLRLCLLPPLLL